MKNIFLIILTLFFAIISCKNKATETKVEPSTKDTTATKEEPTATEVGLTDEQIKDKGEKMVAVIKKIVE